MIKHVLALSLSVSLCCAGPARAQQPAAPLTFAQALAQAVANSHDLRKADLSVAVSSQDIRRARSVFLPRLDLTSTLQNIEAFASVPGLESLLLGGRSTVYSSASGLTLSLNAFNGGMDLAAVQTATERRDEAGVQARIRRTMLATTVLDRYHALRQAELDLAVARLRQQAKRDYSARVQADYTLGKKSAIAVSEASYDSDSSALTRALRERAWQHARRDLEAVIGTPVPAAGERSAWARWSEALANGGLPAAPPTAPGAQPLPAGDALAGGPAAYSAVLASQGFDAMARYTDVDIASSRVRQASIDVRRARGRYLPRVDFFLRNNFTGINESSFGSSFNHQAHDKRIYGVTFTWNLFDGFDSSADLRAASLRVQAAEADRELAREEQKRRAEEWARPLADAIEEQRIEVQRFELMKKKVEINRVKLELGRIEAGTAANDQTELSVQELELEKRAETISYYQAKLMLRTGGA